MEKKQEIKKIYRESFSDTAEYVEMYFDRVYDEREALVCLAENGMVASSLLLQRYKMTFGKETVDIGYIAAAATRRQFRDRGYMKRLVADALAAAKERGDLFVTLIPAAPWLFDYYARFGFSTVFYIEEQRYTSIHRFVFDGDYVSDGDIDSDEVYEAFDRMMRSRPNCVLHSRRDFSNIIADNRLDRGAAVVIRGASTGEVAAIAFGVMREDSLVVKDLLARDADAAGAALDALSRHFPHVSVTVVGLPDDNTLLPIESRAMARMTDVLGVLKSIARQNRQLKMTVRVSDDMISDNNHIYFIDNGTCTINDGFRGQLDLDVTVDVMTAIVFSSEKVGRIFSLPTHRPFISLMLD